MTSYGKPKDKVASYAKAGTLRNNLAGEKPLHASTTGSHHPSSDSKKKYYRARGCRGGASRKGRKKQFNRQQHHDDRQEVLVQEISLDPTPNKNLAASGFVAKDLQKTDDQGKEVLFEHTSLDNISSINHSYTDSTKMGDRCHKKVTFAPSHYNSSHTYNHYFTDTSKEGTKIHKFMHPFTGRGNKNTPQSVQAPPHLSILPKESDGNIELLLDENCNPNHAFSPANRANTAKESPARSPGFSFFSISPRSYLTGKKSKVQKLN